MFWKRRWGCLTFLLAGLLGCETAPPESRTASYAQAEVPWRKVIQKAVAKMQEGQFKEASFDVNLALQDFPKQSALHLLNALIYEEMSRSGKADCQDLAIVGYQMTTKLDPANWCAYYRSGLLRLEEGSYPQAQDLLARAAILKPDKPEVLYGLAMASYYAHDLEAAHLSIQRAMQCSHSCGKTPPPLFLRAAALISSATGQKEKSEDYLQQLQKVVGKNEPDLGNIRERVNRWLALHHSKAYRHVEGTQGEVQGEVQGEQYAEPPPENPAVVFDCYVLSVSENVQNQKGMNVFNFSDNLKLALQPKSSSYTSQTGTGLIVTATKSIAWSPIAYNLNIMNLIDNRVEILARPTLSTFLRSQALFSSGTTLTAGISGSSGGSIVNMPTGVILSIMPTEINGDTVTLDIQLESSLPKLDAKNFDPSTAFSGQVIQILKTKMETTLQIKFNETGIIGGMYGRISQYTKDGFPILEDIPIIQFLSSQEISQYQKTSALFLVTPRRPEDLPGKVRSKLTVCEQRRNLPSLTDWMQRTRGNQIDQDPAIALVFKNLLPANADEYYRRGDVLPIDTSPVFSLKEEVASLCSFLYY